MSAFSELMARIKKKEPGLSAKSARAITAKIGDEKIGKEEMAKRSAASRKEHEQHQHARRTAPFRALMSRLRK